MKDVRITRRGWAVFALALVTLSFALNWAIAGRNLVCDWRTGPEVCRVVVGP